MIVGAPDIDSSDTVSTSTLVSGGFKKIPRYLPTLVYCSLVLSSLAFAFSIFDSTKASDFSDEPYNKVSKGVTTTALAYICTLLHHTAIILLKWLERHESDSIFSFTPSSPCAIMYSLVSLSLWAASTTVCAINLHRFSLSYEACGLYADNTTTPPGLKCVIHAVHPVEQNYWTSLASTITSSLELVIAISITSVCYMHYKQLNKTVHVAHSTTEALSEPKALSV